MSEQMLEMTLDDFYRVYICLSIYATRKHKEQAVWKKFTFKILVPYISLMNLLGIGTKTASCVIILGKTHFELLSCPIGAMT